jgi:hypothetical protein
MNIKAPSYLYKNRHGVFYFRVVIPKKYQQYFTHKREIKRSLRTENKHIALKLSRLYMVDFDKLLTEIKSGKRKTSELITIKDVQLPNGSTLGEISIDHGNATSEYETLMAIINSDSPDNIGNQSSNINTTSSINSSLTLSEVCDLYFEAKSIKDWSDTTYKENRAIFNLLEDLLGKATIFSSITRIDLTNAKNKLVKLPANLSKSKAYRDKTIDQILLMNNVKPMSINSIDKYLTRISGLFGWAFIEGYISTNIAVKYSIGSNSNVARSPFSGTDLTSIFLPTNMLKFDKAYQFWVPIIALYSGARLNEICQLHLSDIQSINNIDVFVIQPTQKNQSTKNTASNRIIPVHSQILQLGFLNFFVHLNSVKVGFYTLGNLLSPIDLMYVYHLMYCCGHR